ncbi:hypothetical protein U9M48_014934 [Paspalum notatum var. saurae]|uniref:Ycf49-like protein n=1 Tax=Paspalum notatum var. saurae TaxID=547442 RepID=A0AAQ3T476_PASNO
MASLRLVAALAPSPPPLPPRRELRRPPSAVRLTGGVALAAAAAAAAAVTSPPALAALSEPANALSLPTWAVHVSSVAEWVTAMWLVWEYGERTGIKGWKGLSWGMVPLLGGAMCACTWHFFYNSESLEVLVALQGALTVVGNITMVATPYLEIHIAETMAREDTGRSSVGGKPPLPSRGYGSNEWRQDLVLGHAACIGELIGRRRSRAQVLLILRCQMQSLVYLHSYCVLSNECNFWPKLGQWPKVSSLLQVFSREILASMMVCDGDE